MLSEDRDEGGGFLDLLSGTNILRVKGGGLSDLDELVLGGLDVLSDELNVGDSDSVVLLDALVSLPELVLVNDGLFPVLNSKLNSKIVSLTLDERHLLVSLGLLLDLLVLGRGGVSNGLLGLLCEFKNVLGRCPLGKVGSGDCLLSGLLSLLSVKLGSLGISGLLGLLGLDLALVLLGQLLWGACALLIR